MPEVLSVALGGGTKVQQRDGKVQVGPESVGHRLLTEGLVFGGQTLTTTGRLALQNISRGSNTDRNIQTSSLQMVMLRSAMRQR
jgi:N-methylhydantoinase A/oxoprolinase/acetone carboxylase beta subunit